MDELSNYLLSGKSHATISPETLELMGKKAATSYLSEGIALNDAISKLAAEHVDISPEQVKRVVEFANTAVYLAKHDQSKTAGAEYSYPQFELADIGRIVQDISDGARPTVVTRTDIDYSREAQKPKLASASLDSALESLFKSASAEEKDYSAESIAHQLISTKENLLNLRENLQDLYNQNESLFKEATADFYEQTKRHLLEGGSLAEVTVAARSTGADEDVVQEVMLPVVSRLIVEKVAAPHKLMRDITNLNKIAHREVNPEHDLVKTFSASLMAGRELQTLSESLHAVDSELSAVQDFTKKAYFDKEAFGALLAGAGKMAGGLMKGKSMAGSIARGAVKSLKNDPIGTVGTAASMLPKKQPAPVPPTNTGVL